MKDEEFKELFDAVRADIERIREEAADARKENLAMHAETRKVLGDRIDLQVGELRRHMDVRFEDMEYRFDILSEAIVTNDEKTDRRFNALEQRVEEGFEETYSLIRYSHRLATKKKRRAS